MDSAWRWIAVTAECKRCGITWTKRNAKSCAARHVRSTGHKVEISELSVYEPVGEPIVPGLDNPVQVDMWENTDGQTSLS